MLVHLAIKDLAIIDNLETSFGPGLNVLSGETGAGKSIILGAVELLMGAKAQADLVRQGAEEARVQGVIELPVNHEPAGLPPDLDLDQGGELILTRVISATGRSRAYVNGNLVNLSVLTEIGSRLLSISGQHQAQRLLKPEEHLLLLDAYAGLEEARGAVARDYETLKRIRAKLDSLRERQAERSQRSELLAFHLEEIEKAGMRPGEEEELALERRRLKNAEQLSQGAGQAYQALYGADGSVVEVLGGVRAQLERLGGLDPELAPLAARVEESSYLLEDAGRELMSYADRVVFDPVRLEEVEERLDLINRLVRKHAPGADAAAVLARAGELGRELEGLAGLDGELERLEEEAARVEAELGRRASELGQNRRQAAQRLSQAAEAELKDLSLGRARFLALVEEKPLAPDGKDRVTFLLSANPGQDPRPLARVASGGELSRVTLALKSILARKDSVETVIFDEVDAGIGGGVAQVVGRKLRDLARRQQILCITHLPQIAACGTSHYRVSKSVEGQRTVSLIQSLREEERVEELARMLAGVEITAKALDHAKEMLAEGGRWNGEPS